MIDLTPQARRREEDWRKRTLLTNVSQFALIGAFALMFFRHHGTFTIGYSAGVLAGVGLGIRLALDAIPKP